MKKTIIFGKDQIDAVARELVELMKTCKVFTFTGPLGAGKTTLIQEMLRQKGVQEPVTSPTFAYLNIYENNKHERFFHFDLYRIATLEDFLAAGFDEYLYAPDSWTFIEWPAPIISLIDKKVCHCELSYENDKRKITITTV